MLRTTGIYFIILVMILVKCFLPDEKPEIIPFPLQSVSDKGDLYSMERTGNDHTRWPPIQQSDRGNTHTFHSHLEG